VIRVENLTKRYADRVAVDDISFSVERGEIIGFLGPNGAGKSTTLRMLTGYLAPHDGRIQIGEVDAVADPIAARRLIGYMPESVPLYRELRVDEYLRYRARLKGVPRRRVAERVSAALEQANVTDVRHRIIGQLSKGYRSRVGLADALVADPPLLILDEPTAGLDPNQIRQVRDLVRSMAGKKTVLLSTHILPEVESTCERVLIIDRGRVVGEGTPAELRTRREGSAGLVLEGRGPQQRFEDTLRAVPGVRAISDMQVLEPSDTEPLLRIALAVDSPDVADAVFPALASAGLKLRELRRPETSLEEVFASLTHNDRAAEAAVAASEPEPPAAEAGPGGTP
jgi:ABC-2 type transport system ATP-binding protein